MENKFIGVITKDGFGANNICYVGETIDEVKELMRCYIPNNFGMDDNAVIYSLNTHKMVSFYTDYECKKWVDIE